jgi:putative phosphonoacetaldehyde dehydrogenase
MLLDGVVRAGNQQLAVVHPVDGAVVGHVARDSPNDVAHVLAHVARARSELPVERRSAALRAAATKLADQRERFARLITQEAGTCLKEAGREVDRACGNLTVAAEEALRLHGEALRIHATGGDRLAFTIHEPVGVVCAITPFNRPLNQVVVKVAPAIAAGASIVVKPSELAPLSCLAFVELLIGAGLPASFIAVVTGLPSEIGEVLITSSHVDMVTFTGSIETGERIMAQIGLRRALMELGGNGPLIVLADADLDRAATLAAAGAFATAGQSCRGVKRVIAIDSIAAPLVERLAARARELRCGDLFDPSTDVSAMINVAAAERVERRCQDAISRGAVRVCGGERQGPIMTPCVLDRVSPTCELVAEETFGPVAPILRVRDLDEAIAVANSTRYGLQAGVLTRDLPSFLRLARALRVGAVNFDEGPHFDSPHIPFGGVKRSGLGREGVRWAIREMTTVKTVVLPWGPGGGG